jgi:hypothetical protein
MATPGILPGFRPSETVAMVNGGSDAPDAGRFTPSSSPACYVSTAVLAIRACQPWGLLRSLAAV